MNLFLRADSLSKKYGYDYALQRINIEISSGEIFGILGSNAAGKTTLLKLFASLIMPTDGFVEVMGLDSRKNRKKIHSLVGYLSHKLLLYKDLSGIENLQFYSKFYPVPIEGWEERINELLNLLRIKRSCHEPIKNLSSGLQKRFDIARVFLHDPELILLDEPFSDLDLESQDIVSKIICRTQGNKITVLSTHNLNQAKISCKKIAVLLDGKMIKIFNKKNFCDIKASKLSRKVIE